MLRRPCSYYLKQLAPGQKCAVNIQIYGSKGHYSTSSGGYTGALRRLFGKTKGVWSSKKPAQESPIAEASRKLKEFVSTVDQVSISDSEKTYVKELVLKIIEEAAQSQKLDPKVLTILDQAISANLGAFSDPQKNQIFNAVFRGNDDVLPLLAKNKDIFSLCTKLFSALSRSLIITNDQRLGNGIYYFGLMRAAGYVEESRQLLESLLVDYEAYSVNNTVNKMMVRAISYVRKFQPDLKTIELIADNSPTSMAVFHEAISTLADMSSSGSLGHDDPAKFTNLVLRFLQRDRDSVEFTHRTIIMVLDTCLSLPVALSEQLAVHVTQKFALPNLRNAQFLPEETQEKLQYYELLLLTCAKFVPTLNKEGKSVLDVLKSEFYDHDLDKETWDVLLKWYSATSNDPATVTSIVDDMVQHEMVPDEETLNSVLEGGYRQSENYVEEILTFFKSHGIFGDVGTYSLLVKRALDRKDALKAVHLFENSVQKYGCSWTTREQLAILDRLLVEMSEDSLFSGPELFQTYQKIRSFTKSVGYQAKLALLFTQLERESGYIDDVGRLLAEEFSNNGQRVPVTGMKEAFDGLLQNLYKITDDEGAWRLFGYMNKYLQLPASCYIPIIQKFCSIGRPDAALLIFKSYRLRHKAEKDFPAPGAEMYITLMNEFGQVRYEEGVFQVHAFFKMDLEIENDTPILNSILRAYSMLENRSRCMDTYMDICAFPPGQSVDNDTVSIMLKEFTNHYNALAADEYFSTVFDQYGLTPTPDNVKEYIVSTCANGLYMRSLDIAKHTKEEFGFEVTPEIVEALYNYTLLEDRKKDVKYWAVTEYPKIWATLESAGKLKHDLVIPPGDGNYRELPQELKQRVLDELIGPQENFVYMEGTKSQLKMLK